MLDSKIESILFIAARPLSVKKLMETVDGSREEVNQAVDRLAERYNVDGSGIRLLRVADSVQLATSPENSGLIQEYLKDETTGELTKPSLETLTIIAYRGPISKAELEQIRGVNCSLIIRNLMMRGLVEASGDPGDITTKFNVTMDFVRFLGVNAIEELPDYDTLRSHENIERALQDKKREGEAEASAEAPEQGEGAEAEPSDEDEPEDAEEAEDAEDEDESDDDGDSEGDDEDESDDDADEDDVEDEEEDEDGDEDESDMSSEASAKEDEEKSNDVSSVAVKAEEETA